MFRRYRVIYFKLPHHGDDMGLGWKDFLPGALFTKRKAKELVQLANGTSRRRQLVNSATSIMISQGRKDAQ